VATRQKTEKKEKVFVIAQKKLLKKRIHKKNHTRIKKYKEAS
jgi:hypothetical protein